MYTVLSAHSQLNTPEKLAVLKVPSHQRHCIKSICVKQRNQRFLPRYCKLFSMFIKTAKTAITTGLKRIATVLLRCHRHEKCSDCNKVTAPSLIISSEHDCEEGHLLQLSIPAFCSYVMLAPWLINPSRCTGNNVTLAVDGRAVTFGIARMGLSGLLHNPVPSLLYQM